MVTVLQKSILYRINAPSAAALETVMVRFNGEDVNTSVPVSDSTTVVDITAVQKAELTLSAVIASPEAQDGEVSVDAPFEIKGVVENGIGYADIDTSLAKARIRMVLPASGNYTFDPTSDSEIQAFSLGDTVSWIVRAPSTATGPELLTVRIENVPDDENTNAAAGVAVGQQAIAMQTGSTLVTVDNVSAALGIGASVVPKGTNNVTMLAVEVANPEPLADPARVDYIDVALLNSQGIPVTTPAATITALYAINSADQRINAILGGNPMRLPVAATIGATAADTFRVYVSISGSASLEQFTIAIADTSAIFVVNTVSQARVSVVDKTTLGGLRGQAQLTESRGAQRCLRGVCAQLPESVRCRQGVDEDRVLPRYPVERVLYDFLDHRRESVRGLAFGG